MSRVILDMLAFVLVAWFVYRVRLDFSPVLIDAYFIGVLCTVIFSKYLFDCYSASAQTTLVHSAGSGLLAVVVAGGLLGAGLYVLRPSIDIAILWRGNLPLILAIFALFTMAVQVLVGLLNKSGDLQHDWFFFGSLRKYEKISSWIQGDSRHLRVTRIFPESIQTLSGTRDFLGDQQLVIEDDVLTNEELPLILELQSRGVRILNYADFYEKHFRAVPLDSIPSAALVDRPAYLIPGPIFSKCKRLVDIISSLTLLLMLSPVWFFTYMFIVVSSGRPALFRQKRTGLFGKSFVINKFRTMRNSASEGGAWTTIHDPRLLVGARWIRKWRLDELPQLWNVLKGDMSLIGPRPEQVEITKLFHEVLPLFVLREAVRPGLSGWAQVEHGYADGVDESERKLEYDLYYLKHQSFSLDMIIFVKTLKAVFRGSGR